MHILIHGANSDYMIRLAEKGDLSSLPAVETAAASIFSVTGYDYLTWENTPMMAFENAQEHGHLWVIVDQSAEVVGFAMVSIAGQRMHLEEIDIHPDHNRQGLGGGLINFLCDWAKANGLNQVSLSTFREVPWNAPYYTRLGFTIIPKSEWIEEYFKIQKHEAHIGLPVDDRVIMQKSLQDVSVQKK